MIEIITKHLPLIVFLVVVLALVLLFIRTDAIEKALAQHTEKTADTFGRYHKRMDGTGNTLGHLDERLRKIESMATTVINQAPTNARSFADEVKGIMDLCIAGDLGVSEAGAAVANALSKHQSPAKLVTGAEAKPAVLKLTPCSAMSNAEVMEALERIQTLQGELFAKGVKFTYHVTFPS